MFEAQYPAIYRHLLNHKTALSKRNKAETGIRYEWYALQRWAANYHEEFMRDKIVWSDISIAPTFQFVMGECYFNNTAYMIVGNHLKYIIGILNSSLIKYYFPLISTDLGTAGSRYFKIFVEKIPIPKIADDDRNKADKIIDLVDSIIADKAANRAADTSKQEIEIDETVFALYKLSEEEIAIVETVK